MTVRALARISQHALVEREGIPMPPNLLLVLVAAFGFALHALSTDGGGTVLARIGITTWAIPKGAIAPMLVVIGLGYAVLQGVQNGLSWQDAATQGAIATLVALGGVVGSQHLTGRDVEGHSLDVTPPKNLVMLIGVGICAIYLQACGLLSPAQEAKGELVAKDIACIVEKAYLDEAALNMACDLLTPERQAAARALVAEHKQAVAKQLAAQRASACGPTLDGGAK